MCNPIFNKNEKKQGDSAKKSQQKIYGHPQKRGFEKLTFYRLWV